MKIIINGQEVEVGGGGTAEEIYSTEETRIGTWIDGKPLYRKVFSVTTPPNSIASGMYVVETYSANIEHVCHLYGTIDRAGFEYPVPMYVQSEGLSQGYWGYLAYYTSEASKYPNTLQMGTSDYLTNRPATIVLEYTKTTD